MPRCLGVKFKPSGDFQGTLKFENLCSDLITQNIPWSTTLDFLFIFLIATLKTPIVVFEDLTNKLPEVFNMCLGSLCQKPTDLGFGPILTIKTEFCHLCSQHCEVGSSGWQNGFTLHIKDHVALIQTFVLVDSITQFRFSQVEAVCHSVDGQHYI